MTYHYIIQCRLLFDDEDCLIHVEAENDKSAFEQAEVIMREEDEDNDKEFIVQGHAKFATPPLKVIHNW